VPSRASADVSLIDRSIATANMRLPEYARVRRWAWAPAKFTAEEGLLTGNGRLRRDAIVGRYGWLIDSIYREGESARRGASA